MVKSERKFASDVTIIVPRSVLKVMVRQANRRGKVNAPLWGVSHLGEGLGQPFPIQFGPRDVLVNWLATVLSQQSSGSHENKAGENEVFVGRTLWLGFPVYTVMAVIGRARSTTLGRWFTSGNWQKAENYTPFLDGVYLITLQLEFFHDFELAVYTDPFFTRPS